jgi:hypothetical protein
VLLQTKLELHRHEQVDALKAGDAYRSLGVKKFG